MERFKPAAGRLATTYYTRGSLKPPRKLNSDIESRKLALESPPTELSDNDEKLSSAQEPRSAIPTGHTFLWQDLSLDFKTGTEEKRLLDKITGKC